MIESSKQAKADVLNGFLIPLKDGLLTEVMVVSFDSVQRCHGNLTVCAI